MPVETFAAFVAEQAVGLAVGVTAVVVAPKVVPALGRMTKSGQQLSAKVAVSPLSGATGMIIPVKNASLTIYEQMVDGCRWYGEKWDDLIVEAKDMQAARTGKLKPVLATPDLPDRSQLSLKQKGRKTMLCQYNFDLPVDPYQLMSLASQVIVEHHGTVTGELPEFTLSVPTPLGEFDGVCKLISDSTINVVVTKKPELVSCEVIRHKLVEYLTLGVKMHVQAKKEEAKKKENSK